MKPKLTPAGEALNPADRWEVVRSVGNLVEETEAELNTERGFAFHLAAHAVAEEAFFGTCSKTLNIHAPCPYCGKLPPDLP